MPRPSIPKYEPETIEAEAKKSWRGDDEKVATTSVGEAYYDGIKVTSRYSKGHEMDLMLDMIEGVDQTLRQHIDSLFCDSKATSCYEIKIKGMMVDEGRARKIGEQMAAVCRAKNGGYNQIIIKNRGRSDIDLGADWDE